MLDQMFAPPPRTADLLPEEAALVSATRKWVMAQRVARVCPIHAAAQQLGSLKAARSLHVLLAHVGASWPDAVAVAPPCCPVLTHDEATLLGMVIAANRHTRPVFDALTCEMLGQAARDRLHDAAVELGRLIDL
ncbi:MAG TPA: addiction module antidote protein [Sphingomonas sp.]|jgi:hypothetical protein|nr:addiction module antidote protein [Sphingomonas sp.]